MKKRINIILAFFLVISVCANVFFIKSCIDAKDQAETLSRQATITDETINELNSNLSDLENQLTDSMEQIKILEDSLAEMQESAALDDDTAFDGNGGGADISIPADFPYIDREPEQPAVEQQQPQQESVEQSVESTTPQQPSNTGNAGNSNTPVNTMPGGANFGDIPVNNSGTGDGGPAAGIVGSFE
ncbi:MAG: hypothetical protein NC420_07265 [Eubacterium sp.]|nr:hypothetical protein [Eubacterium sp.]